MQVKIIVPERCGYEMYVFASGTADLVAQRLELKQVWFDSK